jgi:hypothetical protein
MGVVYDDPEQVPFPLAALFSECKLTGLQRIDIGDCGGSRGDSEHPCLTGNLVNVAMHSNLRHLRLEGCSGVTGDLSSLASLTALKTLEIIGTLKREGHHRQHFFFGSPSGLHENNI